MFLLDRVNSFVAHVYALFLLSDALIQKNDALFNTIVTLHYEATLFTCY